MGVREPPSLEKHHVSFPHPGAPGVSKVPELCGARLGIVVRCRVKGKRNIFIHSDLARQGWACGMALREVTSGGR